MANRFPPPPQSAVLLLLLLLIASVAGAPNSTGSHELGSALELLRSHGYTLFTNAVTTSDLQYELLTTTTSAAFTLFAPKDEMLFALDMATDAAVYVNTLRYHVIPNHRYTFADLQNLSSPFLDTLLPHFAILVGKTQNDDVFSDATVTVMVDGVHLSNPDIFLGSRLAVHGIDGILLSGLNMTQDSDAGGGGGPNTLPTVEPPAPVGLDTNIRAEEMFRFDWKNPPPSPVSAFNGDMEMGGTPPASQFAPAEMGGTPPASQFAPAEMGGTPPTTQFAPAEMGGTPPTFQFSPASTFHGSLTPVSNHFDLDIVPGALESPMDGNIPVRTSPQDQMEKLKDLAKKKREKQHRKGRRRHHRRRHTANADHVVNEL